VIMFSRDVDATTVTADDFAIACPAIDTATAVGSEVTLGTAAQTPGTGYILTAAALSDSFGHGLTGNQSTSFDGFELPPSVTMIAMEPAVDGLDTLYTADESSGLCKYLRVTTGGIRLARARLR